MSNRNFILFLCWTWLLSCQIPEKTEQKVILNLGESSSSVQLFGEHLISTSLYERDLAISPNGDEIIFTQGDYKQRRRCLVLLEKKEDNWEKPTILSFSGIHQDIEPFYANDGNRLYFASNRPIYDDHSRKDYNIWYSDRTKEGWANPIPLDTIINTTGDEYYPSLSQNGNLYFTATRADGIGREDIFKSTFTNGQFAPPVVLPEAINTAFFEFNAFISPGEEYLIFSSFGRKDGQGGGDLYISEKDAAGNWEAARNMGEIINSDKLDYCPFVDVNSKTFYFTSERTASVDGPFKDIEELKKIANQAENGFGNIYKVSFESLGLKKK